MRGTYIVLRLEFSFFEILAKLQSGQEPQDYPACGLIVVFLREHSMDFLPTGLRPRDDPRDLSKHFKRYPLFGFLKVLRPIAGRRDILPRLLLGFASI